MSCRFIRPGVGNASQRLPVVLARMPAGPPRLILTMRASAVGVCFGQFVSDRRRRLDCSRDGRWLECHRGFHIGRSAVSCHGCYSWLVVEERCSLSSCARGSGCRSMRRDSAALSAAVMLMRVSVTDTSNRSPYCLGASLAAIKVRAQSRSFNCCYQALSASAQPQKQVRGIYRKKVALS